MQPTLLQLPYSPWSERARWALDACGVAYTRETYKPLLGELGLRARTGKLRGTISVPVLFTETQALTHSWDIARYADAHRTTATELFPAASLDAVRRWNDRSEAALAAGRTLSLERVLESDDAVLELVPKSMRQARSFALGIGRFGVRRTLAKYRATSAPRDTAQAVLTAVLDEVVTQLRTTTPTADGTRTLLGAFSYADITVAQILMFVAPPNDSHVRIGTASRSAFADPALAERYAELVSWRDSLYRAHR